MRKGGFGYAEGHHVPVCDGLESVVRLDVCDDVRQGVYGLERHSGHRNEGAGVSETRFIQAEDHNRGGAEAVDYNLGVFRDVCLAEVWF